jgi:hypothetical protein
MWCEMPASHHGILPPAVKKSPVSLTRLFDQTPIAIITKKYPQTTTQSSVPIRASTSVG